MSNPIQAAVLKACRHFMMPIARFLLRNGVGYREFSEISKLAFVQVASDEYGIRGRKTNMSRVAVMTGLTRKEVRRVRDRLEERDWDLDPQLSRPGVVLSHWYTDPEFLDKKSRPKPLQLPEGPRRASFAGLVRRYGGDIPPGAMLKELARAGCVRQDSKGYWHVIKREFSPRGTDAFLVERFGECIHDLADTMSHNMALSEEEERRFEFRAWNDNVDPSKLAAVKALVYGHGRAYLEAVDDALSEVEAADKPDKDGVRCGVHVFYFEGSGQPGVTGG